MNKSKKILLVEDEAIVAMTMEMELSQHGYLITGTTGSGEEACEMFKQDPSDIVLMDIQLNGTMNGVDTALQINGIKPVPVIFMTGYSENSDLFDRLIKDTADQPLIIEKPVAMEQLLRLLEDIVSD